MVDEVIQDKKSEKKKVDEVIQDKKSEKKKVDRVPYVPPFAANARACKSVPVKLHNHSKICLKPVAKVAEGKPGMTYPDYSNQVEVAKIVQSYKDETGLAYAMRQINNGRLMPSQLMDKGDRSADVSNLPDNINDAYREKIAAAGSAAKVANALDLSKVDSKNLDAIISKAVEQKFAAMIQKQSKEVKKDE